MAKNTGSTGKAGLSFSSRLRRAITIILKKNLAVKKNESLLIVYDSDKEAIANHFREIASGFIDKVERIEIPLLTTNGQEPPDDVSMMMLKHDVVILLTTGSLSHTGARRKATEKGVRIASMPGITESVLERSIDIDYKRLKEDIKRLAISLNRAKTVKIETALGTDITFSIDKRKAHGLSAGIYNKKGRWGNLPEGEVFIAPVEGSANGHFVVDGSIAGFGKPKHPLVLFVKGGYVIKITNGRKPHEIEDVLDKIGKDARNIAEFGIGLNRKAKVTGIVLEDEKAYGTCHLALGNNIGFGGKVDVPLHIDCVIKKPTIWLDGKMMIKKGKVIV